MRYRVTGRRNRITYILINNSIHTNVLRGRAGGGVSVMRCASRMPDPTHVRLCVRRCRADSMVRTDSSEWFYLRSLHYCMLYNSQLLRSTLNPDHPPGLQCAPVNQSRVNRHAPSGVCRASRCSALPTWLRVYKPQTRESGVAAPAQTQRVHGSMARVDDARCVYRHASAVYKQA